MSPAASTVPDSWMNHVLWVDDVPDNNVYERREFETVGLRFTLARSTEEAFERLSNLRFAAIISDMGRREGPRAGYVLLDRLRAQGDHRSEERRVGEVCDRTCRAGWWAYH